MAWVWLLRIVNPPAAYWRRQEAQGRKRRGTKVVHPSRHSQFGPVVQGRAEPSESRERERERRVQERRAHLEHMRLKYGDALRTNAQELLDQSATTVRVEELSIVATLIRFWNGAAILEARRSDLGSERRTAALIDRRPLRDDPIPLLANHLLHAVSSLSR